MIRGFPQIKLVIPGEPGAAFTDCFTIGAARFTPHFTAFLTGPGCLLATTGLLGTDGSPSAWTGTLSVVVVPSPDFTSLKKAGGSPDFVQALRSRPAQKIDSPIF